MTVAVAAAVFSVVIALADPVAAIDSVAAAAATVAVAVAAFNAFKL